MKRRSFLAMLGLAPVAAAVPAAKAGQYLNTVAIRDLSVGSVRSDDLARGAVMRSWTCPEYAARLRAGLSTEPTRIAWVASSVSDENPSGLELLMYVKDRIVHRVWWTR